ncbi:MAG TPA: site-specific integrase, partial [Bryobacteraceae bacterium]|nr:site-specific integrase [Bryobacteraceae bacterium]
MPELAEAVDLYLASLARENASAHTIRNYAADLAQFLGYLGRGGAALPPAAEVDQLLLREWLADLYSQNLQKVTIRRKLAAIRGLFEHLLREAGLRDQSIELPARFHLGLL